MKPPALARTVICAGLLCPVLSVPAHAEIVRHCKGCVGLRILSGTDRTAVPGLIWRAGRHAPVAPA